MAPGLLLIRTDAGASVGYGHAVRCLALAQAWKQAGGHPVFAMAQTHEFIRERIASEAFSICTVDAGPGTPEDAAATAAFVQKIGARWLVIDGYHFGGSFARNAATEACRTLRVDDLGSRDNYSADIVLNQNIHAHPDLYPGLGRATLLLLGPRYALVRKEFQIKTEVHRKNPAVASKILVTCGGTDQSDLLVRIVEALSAVSADFAVRIVSGGSGLSFERRLSARLRGKVSIECNVSEMKPLMTWADLAISAAGSTLWELCSTGLPSILIDVAENQRPLAQELHRLGAALHVPLQRASSRGIGEAIEFLLHAQRRREQMSLQARALVDGRGAPRVVAAMRSHDITLRSATLSDRERLWEWANDPTTRAASFNSAPIAWEVHCAWFERKLEDPNAQILIIEEHTDVVGTVRFQRVSSEEAEIGIALAPHMRGFGLGQAAIERAVTWIHERWNVHAVRARIKPANSASRHAFENAGFKLAGPLTINNLDALMYVRNLPPGLSFHERSSARAEAHLQ